MSNGAVPALCSRSYWRVLRGCVACCVACMLFPCFRPGWRLNTIPLVHPGRGVSAAKHLSDKHLSDKPLSDKHLSDKHVSDKPRVQNKRKPDGEARKTVFERLSSPKHRIAQARWGHFKRQS